jgi:hypothetical protein
MDVIDWKKTTMFRVVEGVVGAEEFVRLAAKKAKDEGRRFDPRRYFVGDDELIQTGNRTYAFTNQWGNRTLQAIDLLKEAFPDTGIRYEKCSS